MDRKRAKKRRAPGGQHLVGDTSRREVIAAFPSAPWANVAEGITGRRGAGKLMRGCHRACRDIGVGHREHRGTLAGPRRTARNRFGDGRCSWAGAAACGPRGSRETRLRRANNGVQDAHKTWPGEGWRSRSVAVGRGPGLARTSYGRRRDERSGGAHRSRRALHRFKSRGWPPTWGRRTHAPVGTDFSLD